MTCLIPHVFITLMTLGSPQKGPARPSPTIRQASTNLTPKYSSQKVFISRPFILIGTLSLLSLLPFFIMMTTSFVKISVVLSIVRSALGTPQIPPAPVITGLSLLLSIYIMAPVGQEMYSCSQPLFNKLTRSTSLSPDEILEISAKTIQTSAIPLKNFLKRHIHPINQRVFIKMRARLSLSKASEDIKPDDFIVLIPAFIISELKEAFQIGFIIFVPFLVIDMTVSNILMALGMQMLSPTTISLPFKLLLFVMIDGWLLLTQGLVSGYI